MYMYKLAAGSKTENKIGLKCITSSLNFYPHPIKQKPFNSRSSSSITVLLVTRYRDISSRCFDHRIYRSTTCYSAIDKGEASINIVQSNHLLFRSGHWPLSFHSVSVSPGRAFIRWKKITSHLLCILSLLSHTQHATL